MSVLVYLIRHGSNDFLGHGLAGRTPGVHLNDVGKTQAVAVAELLSRVGLTGLVSSPMERALETAKPVAEATRLPVRISEALNEINFGEWTGKSFSELDKTELWKRWNVFRTGIRIPQGEAMWEVQFRIVGEVVRLCRENPGGKLALFSHGEPIRTALMHFLGMSLQSYGALEISPASISIVEVQDWGVRVRAINYEPQLAGFAP